jgi:mono/diheme cytochrome c family protein
MHRVRLCTFAALVALIAAALPAAADLPAGLTLRIASKGASDLSTAENVWLYAPAGQPATPFLPAGPFDALWSGYLSCELRSQYTLHAEARGKVKVTVNGQVALDADGKGDEPVAGTSVKFNKGTNAFTVEYTAPAEGDAFLRLYWSNKETPYNPVPSSSFTHDETPELAASLRVRAGRDAFAALRCVKCHAGPAGMPELAMDSPAFAGIGARRRFAWMAKWIENPAALRPLAHMPRVFTGADAHDNAEAVAAFLASLQGPAPVTPASSNADEGRALYEKLHCIACHNPPDGATPDPAKLSQKGARAKFAPAALASFLQNPGEHYQWTGMPNFKLSPTEAGNLAAYLEANGNPPEEHTAPADTATIDKGRKLVHTAGCLNCHQLDGENTYKAPDLASVAKDHADRGCLAETPGPNVPAFNFQPGQRDALRAFIATDRASLSRHTPADFLERQSVRLNCRECHGKFDGFPTWDLLPGKLKPAWASDFIGGKETWKPRPWLEARMPAFPSYAADLGAGLAAHAGFGPVPSADPAPADSADLAKVGQKLAGPNGGLSCLSCHSIAQAAATQVFEAPGVNLAHSFARLQKSYFRRWLRAPTSIDPASKMPVYFDEDGNSPLSEVLGGNGPRTIGAIWEYFRLGDQMPKPE